MNFGDATEEDGASWQPSGGLLIGLSNGVIAMARKKSSVEISREALFSQKAWTMFRELRQTAKDTPDKGVLHQAESFAVRRVQEL